MNEKVWGARRERFERGQIEDVLGGQHGEYSMIVDDIPRAPTTSGFETLSPIDFTLLQMFWDEFLLSSDGDIVPETMARYILYRFGPNISSRAVRHSILAIVTSDGYHQDDPDLYTKHFDMSLRYLQQAIAEHSYIDILYSSLWMVVYSSERRARSEESVADAARTILNHTNAFIICLRAITIDSIEESSLLTVLLIANWHLLFQELKRLSFRSSPRLLQIFMDAGQLAASCITLLPNVRPNSAFTDDWLSVFDIGRAFKLEIRSYLNCWFHLNFISDGDAGDIKRLGSIIRDKLLFYISYPLPTKRMQHYWETKSDVFVLEYALLVEPLMELSQNLVIRNRAVNAAMKTRGSRGYGKLGAWKMFLSSLLFGRLSFDQGSAIDYKANITVHTELFDSTTDLSQEFLGRIKYMYDVSDGEFISEFFEAACQAKNILRLEINGRGLYDIMQLLGREIYYDE